MELASSLVVAFCDVDLSTPLEELDRVIRAARDRNCLAVGSRDAHGARVLQRQSRAREWLGRQYNRLLRATVIDDVRDTQCGAKAAPAAVWAAILPGSAEVGMAWDVEVVAIAQRLDIEVAEVPIEWHHDTRSRVKPFRDGMALLTALPRIARAARAAGRAEESTRPDSAPRPPRAPVDVRR